ncbi:MAG: pyruvate dehydrogenase complex dihydrolipoamide acetyltransferase [Thermoleophilaceae bacterium]
MIGRVASDVTMPRLSDSMEEGTIIRWIVEMGGEVRRGEPLVEIETDKANMTYDADTDGTLIEVIAAEGDTLAVGELIARIGEPGEGDRISEDEQGEADSRDASEEKSTGSVEGQKAGAASSGGTRAVGERPKASPVARRVARELGVELAGLIGSGPGGRIVKADVESAATNGAGKRTAGAGDGGGEIRPSTEGAAEPAASADAPEPVTSRPSGEGGAKGDVTTQELSRMQRTISRRMAESKATAPDFTLSAEVDMTSCVELRERLKQLAERPPSFNDMVIKACAGALRESPRVNGAYRDGHFELYSRVNVGVAVAAHDALVVPTVFDADRKSLGEISRQVRALIAKVGDGKITPPELSGATFTVSNLGMYGVERFTAVINPPQAAILAVGALKKRPVVDESGRIVARDLMNVTLVCDHRILYGADGAEFLARVRELLEQPLALAL